MKTLWRIVRFILRGLFYFLIIAILAVVVFRPKYPFGTGWNDISRAVDGRYFDYVSWEIDALIAKAEQVLWGQGPFMDEADRSQFVRDYMADMRRVHQIEAEIEALFIDPTVDDPVQASANLRAERDRLEADLAQRQGLAESILEGQVAAVLVDEGFGVLGQLTPPLAMRFTEMPDLLVTSPRDRIFRDSELAIDPLPLEEITALEERLKREQDVAAIVVPLGGMAIYPAMIAETWNIPWAIETFAHEWIHHYFFFYPLGLNYFTTTDASNREALIINETVADIFGDEIGRMVLARYYPEFLPSENAVTLVSSDAPAFDYGAAMHETRVNVDRMMAVIDALNTQAESLRSDGLGSKAEAVKTVIDYYVEKAETYMEARRVLFYENGYRIRRMNQAYFAFYGGYQGGIPGIGGEDPIGPAVRDIRAASASLHDFVVALRDVTTREQLLEVAANIEES